MEYKEVSEKNEESWAEGSAMVHERVLLLDRVKKRRQALARYLSAANLDLETSSCASEVLQKISVTGDGLLLALYPSSVEGRAEDFLRQLKDRESPPRIIVLSRLHDDDRMIGHLREGLIDLVVCPDHYLGIYSAIKSQLETRELLCEREHLSKDLKRLRTERLGSIRKAREIEDIHDATLENLMMAMDLRDVETFGHSQTVAKYSQVLARISGVTDGMTLENIRRGALLHDIGKIAIPDSILKKPGPLTAPEWEKIKLHPSLGFGLIKEIKIVKEVGNIILYHHERFDAGGYPQGLRGDEIPFEARIFALADSLDAITSHRPYRRERDFRTARKEIISQAGSQFDPKIVGGFCSLRPERWEKIRYETTRLLPVLGDFQGVNRGRA